MNNNQIEYINALTPFDHGIWEGDISSVGKIKVGENSLFSERSIWLVEKISSHLITKYGLNALENMTILEVGSYDGWVLTKICQRIKFKEAFGIEPRKKNIKKGEVGRNLSKIETEAKFILGDLDSLNSTFREKTFDIVMCLGMLHHVSSAYDAISKLCSKSGNLIIIDTMVIPELAEDKSLIEPYVNTKDIIYHGDDKIWSIAAFKFESPYGDGSSPNYGIVNIPSISLLDMSLNINGFDKYLPLGTEADFYMPKKQNLRGVKEILLISERNITQSSLNSKWIDKVKSSEEIFCHANLPFNIIYSIVENFNDFSKFGINKALLLSEIKQMKNQNDFYLTEGMSIKELVDSGLNETLKNNLKLTLKNLNENHFTILSVIYRSPFEKISFEAAKFFFSKDRPDLTIKYLKIIVSKPGCDWWIFYRSCYLLKKSFFILGDNEGFNHYNELLLLSNENFPF